MLTEPPESTVCYSSQVALTVNSLLKFILNFETLDIHTLTLA